jgi:flagellar basal-body rod protein FlgF
MVAGQRWLDTVTNNLANVNTTGFKRDGVAFQDTLQKEIFGDRGSLGRLGSGPVSRQGFTVFEQGPIHETSNPYDAAIVGPGMFAVQHEDKTFFTRDGAFTLTQDRFLTTQAGYLVLDEARQPIQVPDGKFEISERGELLVDGAEFGRLGVFDGAFQKAGGNLFVGADARPSTGYRVQGGAIEGSNVNAIETMIQMVTISRGFEMAQRSVTQQDDLTQRLIQSLQS